MSYRPGSVIGDYAVLGAVGTGGMGTVYKVQHVITQRIEAMKLLASGRTDPDQEQRFIREMQVQARLHHPNIAAVYNAFRFYDEFFLVLEFIDGESLESVLARGRLPLDAGLDYARQALFALGYAHAHGVVHRDIAPSNMIITPEGTVKLTDFGLAKTTTDIRLTHSGAPLGSPWYMSPEQVRGEADIDARSDIYSLGVVLYEIATGFKPFDLASTFDVMRAQVEMAPLAPIERVCDLPPILNEIILTALAKNPDARFESAEQFYAALEPLQTTSTPAARAAAQRAQLRHRPCPAVPVSEKEHSLVRERSLGGRVRLAQAAVGTAACGLTLFGSYATYAVMRATSVKPQSPLLTVPKPSTPPPAAFLLFPEPPAPAQVQASEPSLPPDPPHRMSRVAMRRPSPVLFSASQQVEELSAPPARIAPAVVEPAKLLPTVTPAVIAETSPSPTSIALNTRPNRPAAFQASPDEPLVITGAADSATAEPSRAKRIGYRFLRALHKVVPLHRQESAEPADPSADSTITQ